MNILCKVFGHRMTLKLDNIGVHWCSRGNCGHSYKVDIRSGSPMPKCKPPLNKNLCWSTNKNDTLHK